MNIDIKKLWLPGLIILIILFGMFMRRFGALQQAGYKPTFLGSAVSALDGLFFKLPEANQTYDEDQESDFLPNPNVITTLSTTNLTEIAEGLFTANPLTFYQGNKYNLRVVLGDNLKPEILKNYYVNLVKDGIVYTLDAREETALVDGILKTRILTTSASANGVMDVAPGEYDGYINMVWDTGTQTVRFTTTVLPGRIVARPTSIIVTETGPTPVPPPTVTFPNPTPTVVAPALFIQKLEVRDGNNVSYAGVVNYQNALWAYAQIYTTGNGMVYNLALVSRTNSANQYGLANGSIDGSGTKEIRASMPPLNNLPTGVYDLTLVAAPRLSNGSTGAFVTRKESVTLVNDSNSNPISIVVPPTNTPGNGDGEVTFPAGTANLNNSNFISGRSCADGGDAVNYSVLALTQNTATLNQAPSNGCLISGDEVLLINLQGIPTDISNVGTYETLKVQSISGTTVTFTTNKKKLYGDIGGDLNLGLLATNQRVMLQRVPNYKNATINSGTTITANSWNGVRGGVLTFRVNGVLNNNGKISMNGAGYTGAVAAGMQGTGRRGAGNTVPHCGGYSLNYYGSGTGANDIGGGAHHCYGSGAGGGNATAGSNGFGNALAGGSTSVSNANTLIMGGGGGGAAGAVGGNGGGIILILANTINSINGSVSSHGAGSPGPCGVGTYTYSGGGGAGGSIYLISPNLNIENSVAANGGVGYTCAYTGGTGGAGRVEFVSSF